MAERITQRMSAAKRFCCMLFIAALMAAAASAQWPTDYAGMRHRAIVFTGRLLCLVKEISPYIIIIMIAVGGLKYIAADDPSEVMMARTMVFDAVIGGACVLIFLAIAESLGVPVNCV